MVGLQEVDGLKKSLFIIMIGKCVTLLAMIFGARGTINNDWEQCFINVKNYSKGMTNAVF